MACEEGTCWAVSLGEACDHWKAENERLRIALREILNTQPFCPAPSPLLGATPWQIARTALGTDEIQDGGDR